MACRIKTRVETAAIRPKINGNEFCCLLHTLGLKKKRIDKRTMRPARYRNTYQTEAQRIQRSRLQHGWWETCKHCQVRKIHSGRPQKDSMIAEYHGLKILSGLKIVMPNRTSSKFKKLRKGKKQKKQKQKKEEKI